MVDVIVQLVSSDEKLIQSVTEVVHSISNLRLHTVGTLEDATGSLSGSAPAVFIAHLRNQPDAERIIDLSREMAARENPVATVVIVDGIQPEQTLALLRKGVAECLERPLQLRRLAYMLDVLTLRARHSSVESQLLGVAGKEMSLDYSSAPRTALLKQVQKAAPLDCNILLQGETGTGKTQLARLIHNLSTRRDQKFLAINCGALSSHLIESEMFGHIRGAFTSADRDHKGKFADVGHGTLFLDEIDSLPIDLQQKLLRVVEERVFEPVGSNQTFPMHARLIAASNRPLEREVAANRFRSDFFYRLNVVAFNLPALREEPEIIPGLVNRFIAEFRRKFKCAMSGIAPDALHALQNHAWPGNIRELRHVIERAVTLGSGERVDLRDLPDSLHRGLTATSCPSQNAEMIPAAAPPTAQAPPTNERRVRRLGRRMTDLIAAVEEGSTLSAAKEQAEAAFIAQVLRRNNNNRRKTATELGISRMTLYKKLNLYGLVAPDAGADWSAEDEPMPKQRRAEMTSRR